MKKQNYRIKPRFNKYKIQDVPEFEFKEFYHHEKLLLQACKDIKNMNDETAQNVKNYILIRLVTIFENEMKAIIKEVIDGFGIKPSQILGEKFMSINLDQLEEYQKTNVTMGSVVVTQYYLTNAGNVDNVLSKINRVQFFEWARDVSKTTDNIFDFVDKIFKKRNNVVHKLVDVNDKPEKFTMDVVAMLKFIPRIYIMTYINLKLAQKNLDSKTKKLLAGLCIKHLQLPLSKFKKITKSHKTKNG